MLKNALNSFKKHPSEFDNKNNNHEENQYLNIINNILNSGSIEETRNGIVKADFGASMHFSLEDNTIPIFTTKRVAWKTCLKELLWFISGNTNNEVLQKQNVKIWNDNSSREFLDSRGLINRPENDLGPVYGHQWRYFNAKYKDCNTDYTGHGIDQLTNIINCLKDEKTRNSRRLIMSAWNPCQLDEMALPPCHVMVQFNVSEKDKLSCILFQRSADMALGVPFNVASYSFLTHIIAKICKLKAKEFIHILGNCHIYDDHFENLEKQIKRIPHKFPKIKFNNIPENIDNFKFNDIEIEDYTYHDSLQFKMRP